MFEYKGEGGGGGSMNLNLSYLYTSGMILMNINRPELKGKNRFEYKVLKAISPSLNELLSLSLSKIAMHFLLTCAVWSMGETYVHVYNYL